MIVSQHKLFFSTANTMFDSLFLVFDGTRVQHNH
jgi:hypothetical protein